MNVISSRAANSARSYAAQDLLTSAHRALQMTGTIYSGMASSIFYLLWRALPDFRKAYGFNDVQAFVNAYGLFETVTHASTATPAARAPPATPTTPSANPSVRVWRRG